MKDPNEKIIFLEENQDEIIYAVYSTTIINSSSKPTTYSTQWRIKAFPNTPEYKEWLDGKIKTLQEVR